MREIVRIRYGSHLFGTSTPTSDVDIKGVYIPASRDILLGRVKGSISPNRAKAEGERTLAGEIDEESYSIQRYLGLLAEGQTVALDLLFAPSGNWIGTPSAEWIEILDNRHRLLSRKSTAFVGYCRQQANKYSIKGSRVAAARNAVAIIGPWAEAAGGRKLGAFAAEIAVAFAHAPHTQILEVRQANGSSIKHLEICGCKMAYSSSVLTAARAMQRILDNYGHRALLAEGAAGADWKALSHAVRVATQGIELLRSGHMTLPLPNAADVLAIKSGKIAYGEVSDTIEALLSDIDEAASASTLPAEADTAWIDDFVARIHRDAVLRSPAI